MSQVNGRVVWGENPNKGGNSLRLGDSDYLRIKQDGDYIIKIMADQAMGYHEHWADANTPEGVKRRSVRCAMRNCTLCAEYEAYLKRPNFDKKVADEMKAKSKWAIEGYLLASGSEELSGTQLGRPVVFEFTKQVFDGISSISKTLRKVGGTLNNSIILVNRDKGRGVKGMYEVTNVPVVKELTDKQKELYKAFVDKGVDLDKMYETPTDEVNMRRLGRSPQGVEGEASVAPETPRVATAFKAEESW